MVADRVVHRRRDLRAGGVVEEDEAPRARERRKLPPHVLDRKRARDGPPAG